MTGIKGRVDIDPTLLTSPSTWDSLIDSKWGERKVYLDISGAISTRKKCINGEGRDIGSYFKV